MGPWSARRRLRGDGGAVLVEFALAVPVLVVFVLGVLDFGFLFSDVNVVERGVQTAGRVAANQGNERSADFAALRALDSASASFGSATIVRAVIYKADNPNGAPPPACIDDDIGVTGVCNVYTAAQVDTNSDTNFRNAGCVGDWDAQWCPTSRVRNLPNPDHIGVYLQVRYNGFTRLIVRNFTFDSYAVYELEPALSG